MTKLDQDKLAWALTDIKAHEMTNIELALICGVKVRRFQQLKAEFNQAGVVPRLNPNRRPRKILTQSEKAVIEEAYKEVRFGATLLRLHIEKNYGMKMSHNKIHDYMLERSWAKEDIRKKRSRTRKSRKKQTFNMNYTGVLGHLSFHVDSSEKQILVYVDDASRQIAKGIEVDMIQLRHVIKVIENVMDFYWYNYMTSIKAMHVDKNLPLDQDASLKFRRFLKSQNIAIIPSINPYLLSKNKRWFRTYGEERQKFRRFDDFICWYNSRVHGGLSRKEGITPDEAAYYKLRPESWLGLFYENRNDRT